MVRRLRKGASDSAVTSFLGGGPATEDLASAVGAEGVARSVRELLHRLA